MGSHGLINDLRARAARLAVGASTARGKGNGGAVEAARAFFVKIDLEQMSACSETSFARFLDQQTEGMLASLPAGARRWGLARKLVNIYFRDAVYSRHLCDHFQGLSSVEPLLELPLDSYTAKGLAREIAGLPKWCGVKAVDRAQSDAYQHAASKVAADRQIARVHLDAAWWGNRDSTPELG